MKTYSELKAAVDAAREEATDILTRSGNADLSGEDAARFDALATQIEADQEQMKRLERVQDMALAAVRSAGEPGNGGVQIVDGPGSSGGQRFGIEAGSQGRGFGAQPGSMGKYRDPWDLSQMQYNPNGNASELRSRALDCVERMPYADDKVREAATRYIERDDAGERGGATGLALATTSPLYGQAFTKMIRAKGQMAALTTEEQTALQRAMSLTDTAGGFTVPYQLDPSVILTANGSVNQIREISRVVQATGDEWHGVTSAGVTGSWDGEAVEVSDDSPTLAQPSIPIHKFQVFVPFSHELGMDAPTLANDVASMIAFEKDAKEGIAFATGSGSGQPTGIVTALVASSPTSIVTSASTDTFALGDVFALDSALPARYAANASWLGHRAIYNLMRRFDTAGGAALWGYLAEGRKSEILGRPDYVSEAMDGVINSGQENYILVFGDFRNYVIADRLGVAISYVPHLFGANGRPTGQAGWHAWCRVGADSVNDAAFKLLNCT